MCDSLVRAKGAVYQSAVRKFLFAILVIVGSWLGHFYGVAGASIGVGVAVMITFVIMSHLSHKLINGTISKMVSSFVPGLILGAIVLIITLPVTTGLRVANLSPPYTLLVTVVFTSVLLGALLFRYPRLLGTPGLWFLQNLFSMVTWKSRIIILVKNKLIQ
jgi:hypothetical protein